MGHESDIECFEMFKMTASVSKLEIMVVAWAKVQTNHKKGGSRKTEVQRPRHHNQSHHISQVPGYEG